MISNIKQEYKLKNLYSPSVRSMNDVFGAWWSIFARKSKEERFDHYSSLSYRQRFALKESFVNDGWCELFCQNHIDQFLDHIKQQYGIDLIDLRIKALKHRKVFLIDRNIWEEIENMILEYEPLFDSNVIFGDLCIKPWGRRDQFVFIAAQRRRIDA